MVVILKTKKYRNIALVVIVFVLSFCLLRLTLYPRRDRHIQKRSSARPKDFPSILIAPESAEQLDYLSPSDSATVPGTYTLRFVTKDSFPGKNTYKFIEKRLKSKGWHRLKYSLLNPHIQRSREWSQSSEPWKEDWLNDDGESVTVILEYGLPVEEGQDPNLIGVHLMFFEKESWQKPWVLQYRNLHPEEFMKDVNETEHD